jgi:hypothetical protein
VQNPRSPLQKNSCRSRKPLETLSGFLARAGSAKETWANWDELGSGNGRFSTNPNDQSATSCDNEQETPLPQQGTYPSTGSKSLFTPRPLHVPNDFLKHILSHIPKFESPLTSRRSLSHKIVALNEGPKRPCPPGHVPCQPSSAAHVEDDGGFVLVSTHSQNVWGRGSWQENVRQVRSWGVWGVGLNADGSWSVSGPGPQWPALELRQVKPTRGLRNNGSYLTRVKEPNSGLPGDV